VGIASYREDIFLRFLEATNKPPPIVPELTLTHYCPFCGEGFVDATSLTAHLSRRHHGARPVLLVDGGEPDQTSTIRHPLRADQIVIAPDNTAAHLRMNGDGSQFKAQLGRRGSCRRNEMRKSPSS
jgi:hypothetical protein